MSRNLNFSWFIKDFSGLFEPILVTFRGDYMVQMILKR